jgi:uncharacterized protein
MNPATTFAPFAHPLYVMLKPVGAACNLRCRYCYYLNKKNLYPNSGAGVMSEDLLERFVEQYLNAQTLREVLFTWHGGEPLMRHRSFYQRALALQRKYARGRLIDNCLQTNGTLLTDDWCSFLKDNNFLVGLSLDGPPAAHDPYRRTATGAPSFPAVMKGLALLQKHGVPFNIMATVNDRNVDDPLGFYHFFRNLDCRYIQFTPVVETLNGRPAPYNVPPDKWGDFLISIFNEWIKRDVGTFFVQYFDATLANWVGEPPSVCTLAETCGQAGVMEWNGDVYSCDHFVDPAHKLGNICAQPLTALLYSDRQTQFGRDKRDGLPLQCRQCRYLFACHGECPKNRILTTTSGEPGLNYLCSGYHRFFSHVAPYMDFMRNELSLKRSPANVMRMLPSP